MTRTFILIRDRDVTGISGTGLVADGVVFPDGTTVVRWRDRGGDASAAGVRPTTVVFDSITSVVALHGHDGATRVVWGAGTATCRNCGRVIAATRSDQHGTWVHVDGVQRGLHRCYTGDSGQAYGLDAEPT